MGKRITAIAIAAATAGVIVAGTACSRPAGANHTAEATRGASATAVRADAIVATVADRPITLGDIDARLGNRLLRLRVEEYRQKQQVLQELIATTLFEKEAARRHISLKNLLAEEVDKKARPVAEEEAAAVYEALPDRFRGTGKVEALGSIADSMRRQRASQRQEAFVKELERAARVRILLEPPRITVESSDGPSRGRADAPVTIVEFSDFQCPYCAQMARILHQLDAQYPGKIRLVFRHFPLPMHRDAANAAEAAACAGDQGKYWEMHDRLFAGQKNLTKADLIRYGADIGLLETRFAACLEASKHTADWQRDHADGERYGVTGTPALFINGRPVFGAATMQDLARVIDDELEHSVGAKQGH